MKSLPIVWNAFKNMMKAAARDPVWAFTKIVLAPFVIWQQLVLILIMPFAVFAIFYFLVYWLFLQTGIDQDSTLGIVLFCITIAVGGFIWLTLVWRLATRDMVNHFHDPESDTHGSARFADNKEIAALTQNTTGLMIGRDNKGRILRHNGQAHLLTMAPTRSGKGVGTIIPNLLTLNRSVICIDPKGENARITARARRQFGAVHILDPFDTTGETSSAFNPLASMTIDDPDIADDVITLSEAIVINEAGDGDGGHWNEEARALVGGFLLHILATETPERKNLLTLRDYLTRAPEGFKTLLEAMSENTACHGLIARAANRHLSKADREAAGVLSTAQRHTHFLDSPRMAKVLSRSDFKFSDLKHETASVFLALPPERLGSFSRWLRLMITQSLMDMARDAVKPQEPVLYLLDEFAALGHLAPIERAMGLMAGYGVQLWPILQDIHQLYATYGQKAGTFLSNIEVMQVFGVNDQQTARQISDMLGQTTIVFRSMGHNLDSDKSGISHSEQHAARPLLTPDEVRTLPAHSQILFLAGKRPVIANKITYYQEKEFQGLFDNDNNGSNRQTG